MYRPRRGPKRRGRVLVVHGPPMRRRQMRWRAMPSAQNVSTSSPGSFLTGHRVGTIFTARMRRSPPTPETSTTWARSDGTGLYQVTGGGKVQSTMRSFAYIGQSGGLAKSRLVGRARQLGAVDGSARRKCEDVVANGSLRADQSLAPPVSGHLASFAMGIPRPQRLQMPRAFYPLVSPESRSRGPSRAPSAAKRPP